MSISTPSLSEREFYLAEFRRRSIGFAWPEDETPDEYYQRCMTDIQGWPDEYYVRHEVPRTEQDLHEAKRGYWNYNTKTAMTKMIEEEGYEVVEMSQFRPGANYAVFRKPGKQNPITYKVSEITLD